MVLPPSDFLQVPNTRSDLLGAPQASPTLAQDAASFQAMTSPPVPNGGLRKNDRGMLYSLYVPIALFPLLVGINSFKRLIQEERCLGNEELNSIYLKSC